MKDVSTIIKNNPSAFESTTDISKNLCAYSKKISNNKERITLPSKPQSVQQTGLGGIPICFDKSKNCVYIDNSDKHSIVVGQTGSKKSRLFAMPMVRILAVAGESMIICDPKAEIFYRSYSYLKEQEYDIKIINLRNPKQGHAWNPLAVAYKFYKEGNIDQAYEFANDISTNLTQIDKSQKDPFWDNSAGSLFFGLIILLFKYCFENSEPDEAVNIKNVLKLRNELFELGNPINSPIWEYAKKDRFIESMLIGTVCTATETRGSILGVFDQKVRAFSIQPSLLDMLTFDDGSFYSISDKPTAVFLLLPDEKTGFHNLVSLYIKQSYEYLIFKAQKNMFENKSIGIRINYILDEFSSLPAISDFPAMITAARSRNIRFNLFLQSKKQLRIRYGDDCDTIMSNCENWIYLSSREIEFLKELSSLCGNVGTNNSKPLLSVSDLQRLNKDLGQVLILFARHKPIISCLPDIDYYDEFEVKDTVVLPNYKFKSINDINFLDRLKNINNKK